MKKRENKRPVFLAFLLVLAVVFLGYLSSGRFTGLAVGSTTEGAPLENAIGFLHDFGFFSVVLPFLLIFALVFGILEKTKILGTEKVGDKDQPRHNLNTIVAFSIGFFVVAASNIVQVIQTAIPQLALILLSIIVLVLLFGVFLGEDKEPLNFRAKFPSLTNWFLGFVLIAFIIIILSSFNLFDPLLQYVFSGLSGNFIITALFFIAIVILVWYIQKGPDSGGKKE